MATKNTTGASPPNDIEQVLRQRRSINFFKPELPPRKLIVKAIELARWAPNHHLTEPWHFYLLSNPVKTRIIELNSELVTQKKGERAGRDKYDRWTKIPGWLVVTCSLSDSELQRREDYAACCCAIHSLSLYLWSQGIGAKWTTGEVTRDPRFYEAIWVDPGQEQVVGMIWYGYPAELPVAMRKPVSEILIEI